MNSQDYLKKVLDELSIKYPDYSFNHWADIVNSNHFIEVNPASFEVDEHFIEDEIEIIDNFSDLFFNDSIAFISSDDKKSLKSLSLLYSIISIKPWYNYFNGFVYLSFLRELDCKKAECSQNEYNYAIAA